MRRDRISMILGLGVVLLTGSVGYSSNSQSVPEREKVPELEIGWRWEIEPMDLPDGWRSGGYMRTFSHGGLTLSESADGRVLAVLSQSVDLSERGSASPEFRLVLMDEDGAEVKIRAWRITSSDVIKITRFSITTEAETVEAVGLAVLDLEGRRATSRSAMQEAKAKGASALPLPVIGEELVFDLPTIDGARVRSADLMGKVVLIDCWATWCGPCMSKMPELKKIHETYKDSGLVIVGVNFDTDFDKARTAIDDGDLAWPHVSAEGVAQGIDDLLERSAGIPMLPRLILIGRDGVVIDDLYPYNLADRIEGVMEDSPEN